MGLMGEKCTVFFTVTPPFAKGGVNGLTPPDM